MLAEFPTKTCSVGMVRLEVIWPSSSLFYTTKVLWPWTEFSWMSENLLLRFISFSAAKLRISAFYMSCVGIKFIAVYTSGNCFLFCEEMKLWKVEGYLCQDTIYISKTSNNPLHDFVFTSLILRTPLNILICTAKFIRNLDLGW